MLTSRDRRFLRTHVLEEVIRLDELVGALTEVSRNDVGQDAIAAMLVEARSDQSRMRSMLDLVEEPGYGVCEQCAGFIGVERLLALASATRCITCTR